MTTEKPFVVAVTPIRNRAWMLPAHFDAVGSQAQVLFYLTGDNEDDTLGLLRREEEMVTWAIPGAMPPLLVVEEFNTHSPHWSRDRPGEKYTGDDHASLSRVYNHMIDRALALFPQATHLWLIDSDVLPEPGCLEQLLAADKDVIAPVVEHSPGVYNFMVGAGEDGEPRRRGEGVSLGMAKHPKMNRPNPLVEATFVSCCVLYRRRVLEKRAKVTMRSGRGVRRFAALNDYAHRFAPHPRSHDFPMMASLRAAGVELFVHPRARAEHRMVEPEG